MAFLLLLMFGILFLLMALSIPVAVALGLGAIAGMNAEGALESINLARRTISGIESFPLLAVPLFLLLGELMNASGISRRLFDLADCLVGHFTGGLAQVAIFSNVFLAACSGAATADAAVTSKVLVPIMVAKKFPGGFATAVAISAALLAPLIPPSITFVIYGSITDTSIGSLFMAGIVPGLLTAALLSFLVYLVSKRRGFARRPAPPGLKDLGRVLVAAVWGLLLPVLIIGGIRFGVATPTEIAAVAVIYCLLVGLFAYRELSIRGIWSLLPTVAAQSGAVLLIVAAAAPFAWLLTRAGVPQSIFQAVHAFATPATFLFGVSALLFVLGMFMEAAAILVVMTPIVAPVGAALGVDMVHLGVIITFMLGVGTLSPPFAQLVFVSSAITGIPAEDTFKELWPFLLVLAICAVLLIVFPGISLWLPSQVRGD